MKLRDYFTHYRETGHDRPWFAVGPAAAATLEGCRVAAADVTPATAGSEYLTEIVDVVERNIKKSTPDGARVGVGWLMPQ